MNADIDRIDEPYYVVEKDNRGELTVEVSRFIRAGWKPLGGVAVVDYGGRVLFLQAVVRPGTQI